jgi:pimeloyl-ACP methyl ester carboxylesterase
MPLEARRLLLLVAVSVLIGTGWTTTADAAGCTTAHVSCTEWLPLGPAQDRVLLYRTHALGARNDTVTRALVMVHGAGRDADGYFRTATAAAFLAGALDDTLVIAPRFAANDGRGCKDVLAPGEVNWPCTGHNWRTGGSAMGSETIASFDVGDEILRRLARKDVFPALRAIVVAGHSAGGQYVSRYVMANGVHDAPGLPVSYVVANPSSYAYLDPERPVAGGEMRAFTDRENCTTYDRWPYGLQGRLGYAARVSEVQLRQQLLARPVTFMLGGLDTLPLANLDVSCPAMAQGPHRLARGQAYVAYLAQRYGATHKLTPVPLCGHSARCMFAFDAALPILFPKQ